MILNNIVSFMLLTVAMTVFCFIWMCLDYFTKGI